MVSIVLTVCNKSRFLEQCVASIRGQDFDKLELLFVDDASTDCSRTLLERHAAVDRRINIVSCKNNIGAGAARNLGLANASGEYVWFPDADDFYEPNLISTAVSELEKHQSDLAVFGCDFFDEKRKRFHPFPGSIRRELLPDRSCFSGYKEVSHDVFSVFAGWAWDKVYRKAFIDEQGLRFDQLRTSNDFRFVMGAYIKASSIAVNPEVLVHHRRRVSNSLSNTREQSPFCAYQALENLKADLVKWGIYNELSIDFRNYAAYFLLWHLDSLKWPTYRSFLIRLKNELIDALSINIMHADQFFEPRLYKELQLINKSSPYYIKLRSVLRKTYLRFRYQTPV